MTTTTETAAATPAVTKLSAGRARGVNAKTAPQTVAKVTRGQKAAGMTNAPKKGKPINAKAKGKASTKVAAKGKASGAKEKATGSTFTTVDLATEHGINAKTLRARIRRNIDRWQPLFKDGTKHVFADNKSTRAKVEALLDD